MALVTDLDRLRSSNHGGRQCDGAIASLDALVAIGRDQRVKQSGLTVLFDSGIRSGADIIKVARPPLPTVQAVILTLLRRLSVSGPRPS